MATFHFEVKTGGKGRAAPHSLYIARQGKFRGRDDLVLTGSGNLPFWADGDPVKLWKAADAHERENGNAYREMIVALPNEIGVSGMRNLVEDLVTLLAGSKPYQFAVHEPQASLDGRANTHIHLMVSDRLPDGIWRSERLMFRRFNSVRPETGGCRKDGGGMTSVQVRDRLIALRCSVAQLLNDHLERNGVDERVDHRTLEQQGLARRPERHLGPARIRGMSLTERQAYLDVRRVVQGQDHL